MRAIAIVLLIGCESPLVDRHEVDPSSLLPRNGVLSRFDGMANEHRVVVDFDARTLELRDQNFGSATRAIARTLDGDQIAELRALAQAAVYERPDRALPMMTDVGEMVVVLAGDVGFQANGTIFGYDGWRPRAGELVKAIDELAQ